MFTKTRFQEAFKEISQLRARVAPALLPVLACSKKDASAQARVPVPHDLGDHRTLKPSTLALPVIVRHHRLVGMLRTLCFSRHCLFITPFTGCHSSRREVLAEK